MLWRKSICRVITLLLGIGLMQAAWSARVENAVAQSLACEEPNLRHLRQDHPACLLYTGNMHFRAKQYKNAHKFWQANLDHPDSKAHYTKMYYQAMNNIALLHARGWGVDLKLSVAVQMWETASEHGDGDSYYHLCYVYSNPASSLLDLKKALYNCQQVQSLYGKADASDDEKPLAVEAHKRIQRIDKMQREASKKE